MLFSCQDCEKYSVTWIKGTLDKGNNLDKGNFSQNFFSMLWGFWIKGTNLGFFQVGKTWIKGTIF